MPHVRYCFAQEHQCQGTQRGVGHGELGMASGRGLPRRWRRSCRSLARCAGRHKRSEFTACLCASAGRNGGGLPVTNAGQLVGKVSATSLRGVELNAQTVMSVKSSDAGQRSWVRRWEQRTSDSIVRPMPRLQKSTAHKIRQCSTSHCVSEATARESAPDNAVPVTPAERGAHARDACHRNDESEATCCLPCT